MSVAARNKQQERMWRNSKRFLSKLNTRYYLDMSSLEILQNPKEKMPYISFLVFVISFYTIFNQLNTSVLFIFLNLELFAASITFIDKEINVFVFVMKMCCLLTLHNRKTYLIDSIFPHIILCLSFKRYTGQHVIYVSTRSRRLQ